MTDLEKVALAFEQVSCEFRGGYNDELDQKISNAFDMMAQRIRSLDRDGD